MHDATRLRAGLQDYLDMMDRQRHDLRQRHDALQACWHYTRSVYQGQGADVFEETMRRAAAMMDEYLHTADLIVPLMQQRLAALDQFDDNTDGAASQ